MILAVLGVAAGVLAVMLVSMLLRRLSKRQKMTMWQFGKVEATRPGLKNHPRWQDEGEEVHYIDYKYWIRLSPNPGFNLPVLGYWSKHRGRRR